MLLIIAYRKHVDKVIINRSPHTNWELCGKTSLKMLSLCQIYCSLLFRPATFLKQFVWSINKLEGEQHVIVPESHHSILVMAKHTVVFFNWTSRRLSVIILYQSWYVCTLLFEDNGASSSSQKFTNYQNGEITESSENQQY